VRQTRTYVARNRSDKERTLLIEHPYCPECILVSALQPRERTRDAYRFEVRLPAGKTVELEVIEERTIEQEVVLTGADDQTVWRYVSGAAASPALKEALAKATELKSRWEATRREISQAESQLKAITDDQARLRANLERVPPTSEAYKRYLKKFDEQETEIEKLQDAIRKLQATEQQQRKAVEDFLMNLRVE
jgi:chromosome segregation ATPase